LTAASSKVFSCSSILPMGKIFSTPDFCLSASYMRGHDWQRTYAELNVDGEVVKVGANLLLDLLTTGIGG
jgi:hypothetical protein